jgi:hypothetical protein
MNGSVVTADGRTLIVGESGSMRDTSDPPVAPGGCGLDAEGHIGPPMPLATGACASPKAGRSWTRSGRRTAWGCTPAGSPAAADDAVLLTVDVEVAHAGCP